MAYSQLPGVICLAVAALLSLLFIAFYFLKPSLRLKTYGDTHINGYFRSLLLANAVQAFGTGLSLKWAVDGGVHSGLFCGMQGGVKQAGNVATALWSLVFASHLFNLLFLRSQATRVGFWCTTVGGWGFVLLIVVVGPTAIQKPARGPYFGISGAWCWITSQYHWEQIFLEYSLEFLSAGCCIVLYTLVILRMRGDLVYEDGRWKLRFLPSDESWQLSLRRDLIDYTMLQAIQQMVWYPVVYTLLIIPISLARLSQFAGARVPFWATVLTDAIFNLTGFTNVLLLLTTHHLFPDTRNLPAFGTARQAMRKSLFHAGGITPFMIARSDTAEQFHIARLQRAESARSRAESVDSEATASTYDVPAQ